MSFDYDVFSEFFKRVINRPAEIRSERNVNEGSDHEDPTERRAQPAAAEAEILGCPFCGGIAEYEELGAARGRYCVKCKSCWAKSIYVDEGEKHIAVGSWNRIVRKVSFEF